MRIRIIALGTRGDVQPCVALAHGLSRAGHDVRVAADAGFEPLVRAHGIDFVPIQADARSIVHDPAIRKALERKRAPLSSWRMLSRTIGPSVHQRFVDCWRACQDGEAILVSPLAIFLGYSISQKIGRPLIRVLFAPIPPATPLTKALYSLYGQIMWSFFRPSLNRARQDVLGLPPLPMRRPAATLEMNHCPVLCAYSPSVYPRDPHTSEWWHVTGYWFADDTNAWDPPRELLDFLGAGSPPVYVGFGSMMDRSPAETTKIVLAALARSGQRGILATGWGGLQRGTAAEHAYVTDDLPHGWLFPRVSAVVHHGGAGTTASGLRAGRPTVVVPFGLPDQPIWGERVHALGVGPPPVFRKQLSVDRLADAMRTAATDPGMRDRAAALGARIRAEDGIARAIEVIEASARPL